MVSVQEVDDIVKDYGIDVDKSFAEISQIVETLMPESLDTGWLQYRQSQWYFLILLNALSEHFL